ncbi:hypothetical protein PIB30_066255 [Stylosanthes scabra]|uniref:PB1-like domain-containing protein n=1 Tax=Stylosanthes scabra TaxID=79078 RepID=A0ABU6QMY4_9FABA|nr:hypothetical protein [Stylosanthes scabra]
MRYSHNADANLCGSCVSSRWKELGKQIGYLKFKAMFWHELNVIEFDHGLHEIRSDRDINEMCDFTMIHNLTKIHVYLEHPVDVPIFPEVVLTRSSSPSDFYESAEDEAYKSPLPGYESDDSGEESPRKKTRSEFVSPKKKIMNPQSKRYTGKRRNVHILSGSESGAPNGSGFGSASGSGPAGGGEQFGPNISTNDSFEEENVFDDGEEIPEEEIPQ